MRLRTIRGLIWLMMMALPLFPAAGVMAQDSAQPVPLPASYRMSGFTYHAQWWNNCGPATLTTTLSHFGYTDDQGRAANWLKPNSEDKNVSPWQMVQFVNSQVPELPVYALLRYGGTLDTLKLLVANDFPVIIEAGYDPPRAAQGWMGHYLLVYGYDDVSQQIYTHDSYDGEGLPYSYSHIQEFWQHFNYTYIVVYESGREPELLQLLGADADPVANLYNAYDRARLEASADQNDNFAWHNMGSNLVLLAQAEPDQSAQFYEWAEVAFDQAINTGEGLPWRMLWYQFGVYEAYLARGRYNDVITLAQAKLNDGGGQYVEETFYYAGRAREGLGELDRAMTNYNTALEFNPNFSPALEARDALAARTSGG